MFTTGGPVGRFYLMLEIVPSIDDGIGARGCPSGVETIGKFETNGDFWLGEGVWTRFSLGVGVETRSLVTNFWVGHFGRRVMCGGERARYPGGVVLEGFGWGDILLLLKFFSLSCKCSIDSWKISSFDGALWRSSLKREITYGSSSVVVVSYLAMNCPREVLQKGKFGPHSASIVSLGGWLNVDLDASGWPSIGKKNVVSAAGGSWTKVLL